MKDWKEVFQHVDFCPWLVEVGKVSLRGKKKKKEPWSGLLNLAQVPLEWQV